MGNCAACTAHQYDDYGVTPKPSRGGGLPRMLPAPGNAVDRAKQREERRQRELDLQAKRSLVKELERKRDCAEADIKALEAARESALSRISRDKDECAETKVLFRPTLPHESAGSHTIRVF